MQSISRRTLISMLPMTLLAAVRATAQQTVVVYKDPNCGCCTKWVDLLRREGFAATVNDISELGQKYFAPSGLHGCHTAIVGGYIIEGHVPVADVKRLLKERPTVAGLAVPGMPIGSPGMEVPGVASQPYKVLAFTRDGKTTVFASY